MAADVVSGVYQGVQLDQAAQRMLVRAANRIAVSVCAFVALPSVQSSIRREWLVLLLLVLGGLVVRLWALGGKGLAYDEAATALMARATPGEILYFHWDAAFEHPPFWQLTMFLWSRLAGQSEFALRFLPALMGALAVPATWLWVRLMWPGAAGLRLLAAGLVATSPILVLYSQEARMYTVVLVLALLSLGGSRRADPAAARLGGRRLRGGQLAHDRLPLLCAAARRRRGAVLRACSAARTCPAPAVVALAGAVRSFGDPHRAVDGLCAGVSRDLRHHHRRHRQRRRPDCGWLLRRSVARPELRRHPLAAGAGGRGLPAPALDRARSRRPALARAQGARRRRGAGSLRWLRCCRS